MADLFSSQRALGGYDGQCGRHQIQDNSSWLAYANGAHIYGGVFVVRLSICGLDNESVHSHGAQELNGEANRTTKRARGSELVGELGGDTSWTGEERDRAGREQGGFRHL